MSDFQCPWCGEELTTANSHITPTSWREFDDALASHVESCDPWLEENAD